MVDRLIDWYGNSNIFITSGTSNGGPTIIRSDNVQMREFLRELAAADGATDPDGEIALA